MRGRTRGIGGRLAHLIPCRGSRRAARRARRTGLVAGLVGGYALSKVKIPDLIGAILRRRLPTAGELEKMITAKAEEGGPLTKAALSVAKALGQGKSPVRALLGGAWTATKEILRGIFGRSGSGKKLKVTNIVEHTDVGVPVRVAYDQWTRFEDFPGFTKKVEKVEQVEDEKLDWKAQVFWSHRTWESTILEQVPDRYITWRSTAPKGRVDGTVTFHELTPDLTRILLELEYHPQGFVERTGNLWRAPGRRARLELKHFRRHVMTRTLLHPEELEGWRGEIHDGEVVQAHEDALADDQRTTRRKAS
jgi:uncharacterized membrane protein